MRLRVLLLLTALLLTAACSRPADPPAPPPENAPDPGPATLTVMSDGTRWIDGMIAAYQQKYPDRRVVRVTSTVGGGGRLVRPGLEEGEVDVFYTFVPGDIELGHLLSLEPYIKRSGFDLKPYGPFLDQWRHEGSLYALPGEVQPQVLVYNKEMFKAAGVPEPSEGWTWDEFRATARRLTKREGDKQIYGLYAYEGDVLLQTYIQGKTGRPWQEATPEQIKEALHFLATMTFTDKSMPPAFPIDWEKGSWHLEIENRLYDGTAAMELQFMNDIGRKLGQYRFPWGIAPLPRHPGGESLMLVQVRPYGINAKSRNPDLAWEFLQFICGPEGAVASAKLLALPAYNVPAVEAAWLEAQPAPPKESAALLRTTRVFPPMASETDGKRFVAWRKLANLPLSGRATVEDAVTQYVDTLAKIQAKQ